MLVENRRLYWVGDGKREKYSVFGSLLLTPYPLVYQGSFTHFSFTFALKNSGCEQFTVVWSFHSTVLCTTHTLYSVGIKILFTGHNH